MNNVIQIIAIATSALATVVIAIYTVKAHKLSEDIKKLSYKNDEREEKFKEQLKELYKAIVISNFPCAGASASTKMKDFKEHFKNRNEYFEGIFDDI